MRTRYSAVSKDAAVAVKGVDGGQSLCGWRRGQTPAFVFAGEGLRANPSERGRYGFVEHAAHLVCYTSRHCHLHLAVSSAPYESGCVSVDGDDHAESVECADSAVRFGSAESAADSVRKHARYDGNVENVGAACSGPHFHNGPQSLGTRAVVDGRGRMSHSPLLPLQLWTLICSTLTPSAAVSSVKFPTDCLSQLLHHQLPFQGQNCWWCYWPE